MGNVMRRSRWSWPRFAAMFLVAAFFAVLTVIPNDAFDYFVVASVALGFSALAGRYGDRAWEAVLRFFGWF